MTSSPRRLTLAANLLMHPCHRSRGLCLLATAAILTLCGCGEHRRTESPILQRGENVFDAACAGCHTLTGHESGAPGGDLAVAKLSAPDIASFVRIMPVHLSLAEVNAVAAYVQAAAARS